MRDIIWTLIIIWLIYKVAAIFKANSNKGSATKLKRDDSSEPSMEQDGRSAIKKHLNNEGEYVDYEEIK